MERQETRAPLDGPVVSLSKVLKQEQSKGCADRVVFGGLDAFLSRWMEANAAKLPPANASRLDAIGPRRHSYAAMTLDERRAFIAGLLAWASDVSGPRPPATSPASGEKERQKARGTPPSPPPAEAAPPGLPRKGEARRPVIRAKGQGATSAPAPVARGPATRGKTDRASAASRPPDAAAQPASGLLDRPIAVLGGVQSATVAKFNKLSVRTVGDMLYFFPHRHNDFAHMKSVADLEIGKDQTVVVSVWEASEARLRSGRKATEAVVGDETGNLRVIWYNQPYLAQRLRPNTRVVLSGRIVVDYKGRRVFEAPEYEVVDQETDNLIHTGRLVPVYPLTAGLSARTARRLVKAAVDRYAPALPDFLPDAIREREALLPLPEAVRQAHYPDSMEGNDRARRRLAFDELFLMQIAVMGRRQQWQQEKGNPLPVNQDMLDAFLRALPFPLTNAQRRVLGDVLADMSRERPMSRLLQGDVGSGKTVVALAALLTALANGFQGALMAPTEVLAEQHFLTVRRLLGSSPRTEERDKLFVTYLDPWPRPIAVGLLTSASTKKQKQELGERVAAGAVQLLVGTHALIQEGVTFERLGLAVVDEQHRFGVEQRSALRQKGYNPHLLAMTATPIPRTLALTLYGDLDLSVIDEMPPGRKPVRTRAIGPDKREAAYRFIREQVSQGRQAFTICPLIEESEAIEAKAAVKEFQRLSVDVFPDLRLGLLHGRMSGKDKDDVMRRFREGELNILVSTAVVEVGIDVPNATVMLIEGADRFGLAQLHQFRGRVGRGEHPSYCVLVSDSPSEEARERLAVMETTHDGFKLAEEDLRLRGPGEFFGTRQSGLPDLRMARLSDLPLLEMARKEAQRVFDADPRLTLAEHRLLKVEMARRMPGGAAEVS